MRTTTNTGLQDLLAARGPAYDINLDVFRAMPETITGWPGGKPDGRSAPAISAARPMRYFPKRVLIFSPHPDDDVISMGGTLIRLVDQGHEVHVAYQTSGEHRGVRRRRHAFRGFRRGIQPHVRARARGGRRGSSSTSKSSCENKKPGQVDSPEVQQIKGLIRRGEARAAAASAALPVENLHFLDMPFYETGAVRKKPLGEEDIRLTARTAGEDQPAPDLRGRRSVRSARHAPRLPVGDVQGDRPSERPGLVRGTAKSGSTAAPGRNGSRTSIEMAVPLSPSGTGAKAQRDLQAPEPEGPGDVPGRR